MLKKKTIKEVVAEATKIVVAPLTLDFGREDLNSLRDKLNEAIKAINEK